MSLEDLLRNRNKIGNIVPFDLNKEKLFIFDFTKNNEELKKINIDSAEEFDRYIKRVLALNGAKVGIGKYNEDRIIYQTDLFKRENEFRTIHLGIDIFLPAGTKIFSPLDALLHSFQNNNRKGDYGPTIILQHKLEDITFYTLYGHLTLESLERKIVGQKIKKGEVIGEIGSTEVNGNWPEHLHFQIIKDMEGRKGDFPGVASAKDREKYLKICPNPNLILRIRSLE